MSFKFSVITSNATFSLLSTPIATNEGAVAVISLTTTGVQNGQSIPYDITGTGITSADISGASLTDSFVIQNGFASKSFTIAADATTEGLETLVLSLQKLPATVSLDINDTSINPSYILTSNASTVDEGTNSVITLNTTGVANGTTIPYTISGTGITSADLSGASLTGAFVINNGNAVLTLNIAADTTTEGFESLTLTLNNNAANVTVGINDTSILTTYALASSPSTQNEGSSSTITLTTVGVANGTQIPYTISGTGITTADISGASLTGYFTINNNAATLVLNFSNDTTTEGTETLTLTLNGLSNSVSVTIADTSVTATVDMLRKQSVVIKTNGINNANNNTFVDSSINNFPITRAGNTTQGTFSPYGNSGFGGLFNGTGDYLTSPGNVAYTPGTGDFTVEGWIYLASNPSTNAIFFSTYGASSDGSSTGIVIGTGAGANAGYPIFSTGNGSSGTSYILCQGAGLVPLNTWVHLAGTRAGSVMTLWMNGVSVATQTNTSNVNTTNTLMIGRAYTDLARYFPGYISNVRMVKGTAVYTATFTPSTTPLTAIAGTSLLALQDNRFKDKSINNFALTAVGTPSIQAFSPFAVPAYNPAVHSGSMYFDGTGDYLTTQPSGNFTIGTGNFTIEMWAYIPSTATGLKALWTNGPATAGAMGMYALANNNIEFAQYGSNNIVSTTAVTTNAWTHIAVVRISTTLTIYINGVSSGSASSSFNNTTNTVTVGAVWGTLAIGYITDLRFTNTAIYTTSFAVPTAPVPAVTGTQLLLRGTNSGIYDNTGKVDFETVGTALVSTSTVKFGSSVDFSGTGYLQSPITTSVNFPNSSSWTIEAWLRPTGDYANYNTVWSKRSVSSGATAYEGYMSINTGVIGFYTGTDYTSGVTLAANVWSHVAWVFDGVNMKIYANGVLILSSAVAIVELAEPFIIGAGRYNRGEYYKGYMEDFRITKGTARYTANFTPPSTTL